MNKKTQIIVLYYEEKYNIVEIATKLNISKQYVSKIIRSDNRHFVEKQERQMQNKIKRKQMQKPYKKAYKKRKQLERKLDNSYEKLMCQHNQASFELSVRKTINNRAFRNWNPSIYEFHSKTKEYRIKENLKNKISYAVPKKIKWD